MSGDDTVASVEERMAKGRDGVEVLWSFEMVFAVIER